MASNLRMVERDYVVNQLLVSPSKMNQRLSPLRKRSGYKQFIEEQKKILGRKYPFLTAGQIQKRASAMWLQLSRKQKNSYSRDIPKKTKPGAASGLDTLQSWLSSVHIETKPTIPSTPQSTPKLPIYRRRPPTPKAPKLTFEFDENDSDEFNVQPAEVTTMKENTPPKQDETNPSKMTCRPASTSPSWIRHKNTSPQFKVPTTTKKYTEGSMRTTFSSSQTLPIVVESNNVTKGRGILLKRDNPKSKTFRVSFSDVTSILTFEKTPFEKEFVDPEIESGYTLRTRASDCDTTYSLRTRSVPESPNLTRSPRSPLISPLMSLPLRSPRRNRKKEEEEIRKLELQLSADKNRKWIPLLPTTPPILVKMKGNSSQSQSPDQSEPESPFPTRENEAVKNRRPSTPYAPLPTGNTVDTEAVELETNESRIRGQFSIKEARVQENNEIHAKPNEEDLHLQLSLSDSEDSSLPDLAGYDKSGRAQSKKRPDDVCQETTKGEETENGTGNVSDRMKQTCDENAGMDQYSTASEDSQKDEVYYDAAGYESDDSDMERERQLSVLHSNKEPNRFSKNASWDTLGKNNQNPIDPISCPNGAKRNSDENISLDKAFKQKCITHYFEKRPKNSSVLDQESPKYDSDENTPKCQIKEKNSPESTRKVSISVNNKNSPQTEIPRTPRTPRRLPLKNQTNPTLTPLVNREKKFFQTPQNRKIPRNTRQTPSRTAPAMIQRRRSSRLQAKLASAVSDSKVTDFSSYIPASRRCRKPKKRLNMSETLDNEIETRKDKGTKTPRSEFEETEILSTNDSDNNQNADNDSISPVKFYGASTKSTRRNSRGLPQTEAAQQLLDNTHQCAVSSDKVHHNVEGDKKTASQAKNVVDSKPNPRKTKATTKRRNSGGKAARISLCDVKTGTANINMFRKRSANKIRSDSSNRLEDDWKLFETDIFVKKPALPILDPLEDFFDNSSPENNAETMQNNGLETVERTVQSMREAAMNGSFTSPFSSSPKLAKLLRNNNEENSFLGENFSDVSSQGSFEATRTSEPTEQQQADVSNRQQILTRKGAQTFLSDMFGELTPPDRPKRTNRRLCVSGKGDAENNFDCMFDNNATEDNIFM